MINIAGIVTIPRLRAICPKARGDILETIITDAPAEFPKAGLDDHIKIAHFIAQIATESAGLSRLDENLTYTTTARLIQVFGKKRFPTVASAKPFVRNPEALANFVYAGKNGNSEKGDGFAYRGSGLIQLTGRGNFRTVGSLVGMKLESNPELAREPDSALRIALGYWIANKISTVAGAATADAVKAVTKRINPKLVGLSHRQEFFRKAIKAFAPPPAVAAAAAVEQPETFAIAPEADMAAQPAAPLPELSGPLWAGRFPTSRSIDDLAAPFRDNADAFVKALRAAGANVAISATFRPKERAFLMHFAWLVSKGTVDPASVPPMAGVAIRWEHPTLAKSKAAARQMVAAFGMVQIAALNSRHTDRLAIDMTLSWNGNLSIKRSGGGTKTIAGQPRNGSNRELIAVGAGYGLVKLITDPPHWSDDGR